MSFILQPLALFAQVGQTVTCAGGNNYWSWLGDPNWNPQVVPRNNADTNFTVIVPDTTSFTYDSKGAMLAIAFSSRARTWTKTAEAVADKRQNF